MTDCCNEVVVEQVSQAVVVQTSSPEQLEIETTSATVVTNQLSNVEVSEATPITSSVTISQVGTQGIPGPPGTGGYSEIEAGESISIYQVIVSGVDGRGYIADPTDLDDIGSVLGVAISSATIGNTVQYVSTGTITGGSWTVGAKYFLGLNGSLSVTPRALGANWLQFIGVGKTATTFNIILGDPVRIG